MNKTLTAITSSICSIVATAVFCTAITTASASTYNYDVNNDGRINIFDMIALKSYLLSDEVSDTVTLEPLETPIIVSPLGFTLYTDVGHVFVSSLKIINNTDDTLRVSAVHVTMNNRLPIFEASHIFSETIEPKSVNWYSDAVVIDLYVEPELLESVEIQLQFENADTHQFVYVTDMIPIYTTDKE